MHICSLTYYTHFRLIEHYQHEDGCTTKCQDVHQAYNKEHENCQVDPTSLGKILKFVFPRVERVMKRMKVEGQSKRMYVYENLKLKPAAAGVTFEELPGVISQKGRVAWSDAENGWANILLNDRSLEGKEPVKIVFFKQDLSLAVKIGEYEVPLADLHLPIKYAPNANNILSIVQSLEVMKICEGFLASDSEYKRSKKCHLLLSPICATQTCKSCSNKKFYEKYKQSAQPVQPVDATEEESDDEDTIELENTDHEDIKDILARIHPKLADNDAFVELMESQRMALSSQGPTGRRWPKRWVALRIFSTF